jgi:uracil-DNA glycosylase
MKSRRDVMLEEMGLGPTWKLREGAPIEAADEESPASNTVVPESPAGKVVSRRVTAPIQARIDHRQSVVTPSDARRAAIMLKEWPALKADVAACTACALHAKRNKAVFGVGDENADWLFVGEGPGAEEDAQGEPFVGQAGKLLDNMLAAIKLKRGDNVYIANVVKCRPPGNRNPEPGEAAACEPYLHRQIDLIRPKLIVALGKVAAANLLATDASVASMRGRVHEYRGTPLIVTYHPAYLLRTLADKAKAWVDLRFAVRTMESLRAQAAKSGT